MNFQEDAMNRHVWMLAVVVLSLAAAAGRAEPIKALIIDGQNNHDWKSTTPLLKKYLDETGLFAVDVATAPGKGQNLASFKPEFGKYAAIVSNYNGEPWPAETRLAFADAVRSGVGFVSVHAANNAFPDWTEYNEIIGVGGWGGRSEKSGPYVRYRDGKVVLDPSPGRGGSHGRKHPFLVETVAADHPITRGLPQAWLHADDELYDRLRGPAKNLTVLAVAFADPKNGGSGEREPMLMALEYGKGRVFHTTLGHDTTAMRCVGFAVTFQRGAEWAATGKVTQKVPESFPNAEKVSSRD
jgi:type 1 glutamine amidotransferase